MAGDNMGRKLTMWKVATSAHEPFSLDSLFLGERYDTLSLFHRQLTCSAPGGPGKSQEIFTREEMHSCDRGSDVVSDKRHTVTGQYPFSSNPPVAESKVRTQRRSPLF